MRKLKCYDTGKVKYAKIYDVFIKYFKSTIIFKPQ